MSDGIVLCYHLVQEKEGAAGSRSAPGKLNREQTTPDDLASGLFHPDADSNLKRSACRRGALNQCKRTNPNQPKRMEKPSTRFLEVLRQLEESDQRLREETEQLIADTRELLSQFNRLAAEVSD